MYFLYIFYVCEDPSSAYSRCVVDRCEHSRRDILDATQHREAASTREVDPRVDRRHERGRREDPCGLALFRGSVLS